ncbi:MAG: hypothetical protein Alpg2KO_10030 [Alphaproteobacteria bacterium]
MPNADSPEIDPASMTEPGRTALIAGATGAIGSHLVQFLAASDAYDRVIAIGRSAPNPLPDGVEFLEADLVNGITPDWPPEAVDAYCCLGTTQKQAGSLEDFEHLEKGMIFGFARMARDVGVTRMAVVSTVNADPESLIPYCRIKGEIERELMAMEFEHLHIFWPSLLLSGPRPDKRIGERVGQMLSPLIRPLMRGPLLKYRPVQVENVAAEMLAVMTGQMDELVESDDPVTGWCPQFRA